MRGAVVNGRYEIQRELGRGGMGVVHLVEDLHDSRRRLALKVLVPNPGDYRWIERFRVEFAGLSKLRHPNIAGACDFGRVAGTQSFFFTSEYVTGVDIFRGTVNATTAQVLDLMAQTLRGLEVIHSRGYVHNDIKPGNVLLEILPRKAPRSGPPGYDEPSPAPFEPMGRVKIIDFGLFSATNTAAEELYGTPQFLSPERIRGEVIDQRSDLYSLGLVFYALLARALAFSDTEPTCVLRMQVEEKPPSLSFFRPDLPATLIAIVERLMHKQRDERFATAAEALEALEAEVAMSAPGARVNHAAELASGELHAREKEFLAIQEHFLMACAFARDSSALVLRGPAGAGKTRLVRELRGLVQGTGGAYIELPGDTHNVTAVHAASAIWVGFETSGLRSFDEARRETAAAATHGCDARAIASVIDKAVLRSGSSYPILLFFDDFQRASTSVRELALELIRLADEHLQAGTKELRLLIVLGWRSDDPRAGGDPLPGTIPVFELAPLSAAASRELVQALFRHDDVPEAMLAAIIDCAKGLPGRLLELSGDLVEGECVHRSGSEWVFTG